MSAVWAEKLNVEFSKIQIAIARKRVGGTWEIMTWEQRYTAARKALDG